MIPALEAELWPTLGPEICDWIEDHLVHGPGDILGQPVQLTAEVRRLVYRAYEVYPRLHPGRAGRRRFKRVIISRRKGWAKTELAALVALAELDPTAPVRCGGWVVHRGEWVPIGRPVRDPYIPMVAVTEEQTEDLAYGAACAILSHSPLAGAYDIGLGRIMHRQAPGKMLALAGSPSARDGARTTFQHFDESHLFVPERLRRAHATMMRNIPKRWTADAWTLETTTMYAPGEDSIAERANSYATDVAEGKVADPRILYDHLQAGPHHRLDTKAGLRAAIKEASGDAWAWTDVETIMGEWSSAATSDCRRYWLNQPVPAAARWLDPTRWTALAQPEVVVADGDPVVLAFDGSYSRDSTALVGATVAAEPHLFVVEVWERPVGAPAWRTPRNEVDAAVAMAMERWTVVELAPDPPGWHREIEDWEATYAGVVVRFETNQISRLGPAADAFYQLVADAHVSHDGDGRLARHVANCVPTRRRSYVVPTKASPDSPEHIDAAVAAVVATARAMWHAANPAAEHDEYVAFTV